MSKVILGIWDGHDSGAAAVEAGRLIFAVNEERLTRRKLEVHFPQKSIECLLSTTGFRPDQIDTVAYSTTDPAKTLTRLFPSLKEEYYLVRRRQRFPGMFTDLKRRAKYFLTELQPNYLSKVITNWLIRRELYRCGINPAKLVAVDHHAAHAAAAARASGFSSAVIVTLDGIGDGRSGSVWDWREQRLSLRSSTGGSGSLGLFYELATFLLNMRELEDEGKVMALAVYAHPRKLEDNPLRDLFSVRDGRIFPKYSTMQMFEVLRHVHWRTSAEEFAFFVQQVFEQTVLKLFTQLHQLTGEPNVAYAGGGAANVKANMLIREHSGFKSVFVFPHMGDGGLAAGAAFYASSTTEQSPPLRCLQLGPNWGDSEILRAVQEQSGLCYSDPPEIVAKTAELLVGGEVVFWFQGPMEYGPRALGSRSILARADSIAIRDKLNGHLKRRVWFQPFCPSMLSDDAKSMLDGYRGQDEPHMTTAYHINSSFRHCLAGVSHIDGTCRPQIVSGPLFRGDRYFDLLCEMKNRLGYGVVLNTSYNLHGEPLVCSPSDALRTFLKSGARFLVIGRYLVENRNAPPPGNPNEPSS